MTYLHVQGLYDDIIHAINDYTCGEKHDWKIKYGNVVKELNSVSSDYLININQLTDKLYLNIEYKMRFIINDHFNSDERCKTHSIYERFIEYDVVGIYRVIFDCMIFKIKQQLKVLSFSTTRSNNPELNTNYIIYKHFPFKNNPIKLTQSFCRHIHDYNYNEYMYAINHNEIHQKWTYKFNWGSYDLQYNRYNVSEQIKSIKYNKNKIKSLLLHAHTNNFMNSIYSLKSDIHIINVEYDEKLFTLYKLF